MNRRDRILTFLCLAGVCLLTGGVSAIPVLPATYWGTVSINGEPAPVGTLITAMIGETECGRIIVSSPGTFGSNGTFGEKLLVAPSEKLLATVYSPVIVFQVNNFSATERHFISGEASCLDLEVSDGAVVVRVRDRSGMPLVVDQIRLGNQHTSGTSKGSFAGCMAGSQELTVQKNGVRTITCPVDLSGSGELFTVTLEPVYEEPTLLVAEKNTRLTVKNATPRSRLSATERESCAYTLSLVSAGQGVVALDLPVRMHGNVSDVCIDDTPVPFTLQNGTFYPSGGYTSTNTTLFLTCDTPVGSHTITMRATGGIYGDVYEDGRVSATDALYVLHYTVGNLPEPDCCDYADTNHDEAITSTDALYILHYTVGNLNEYYETFS